MKICPQNAISLEADELKVDEVKCLKCGKCSVACPTEAMELIGKQMTVDEIMKEIEKDRIFYDESKGGVTFSGGEPLTQWTFLLELLHRCKIQGIHTTLDTSGLASWEVLSKVMKDTELFLYDIKHMNEACHRKFTGVSNKQILDNLKNLVGEGAMVNLRIPIIPGVNDDDENIYKTSEFIASLKINQVNILPYHGTGADKYGRLGESYKLQELETPSHEKMLEIQRKMKEFGVDAKIGG